MLDVGDPAITLHMPVRQSFCRYGGCVLRIRNNGRPGYAMQVTFVVYLVNLALGRDAGPKDDERTVAVRIEPAGASSAPLPERRILGDHIGRWRESLDRHGKSYGSGFHARFLTVPNELKTPARCRNSAVVLIEMIPPEPPGSLRPHRGAAFRAANEKSLRGGGSNRPLSWRIRPMWKRSSSGP